ncbi:hypothetical protein F4692_000452 [Nocardioides cavernae]|uniref:Uncharacterized protein n=1 Tax=Nocardioides cavernae TaxID=1921566 RepID=A0A7Y9GZX0_9ACTN|nr:hypothetical protein [Nocardioides cavernae]
MTRIIARTSRLVLREPTTDDVEAVLAYVHRIVRHEWTG